MVEKRRLGEPLTDEERAVIHNLTYGEESLPERGTGLSRGYEKGSNPGRMPLDILKIASASGGTYDYVETDQVPPGEIWCIQHYAFENDTGARGVLRLYVGSQTVPIFLKEEQSPSADELVFDDAPIFIREGQRLGYRQTSCTSGDVLKLYAIGYRILSKYIE